MFLVKIFKKDSKLTKNNICYAVKLTRPIIFVISLDIGDRIKNSHLKLELI